MKNLITLINQNFLIRASNKGIKGTCLIGVKHFKSLFKTEEKANEYLTQALESKQDVFTLNLRRGLKIEFISR